MERRIWKLFFLFPFSFLLCLAGCPGSSGLAPDLSGVGYNNSTDPTNDGATYVGSAACGACHGGKAETYALHGHAHAMTAILGGAPMFPPEALRAGVPEPPAGFTWSDISYVVGGYARSALFVDTNGFLLTDGATGVNAQWNVSLPAAGIRPGFAPFEPGAAQRLPLDITMFGPRTTGARPQDPNNPLSQENRPGILGTWAQPGVQCEACHGPGSNHVPNPSARHNFVDPTGAQTCRQCHDRPFAAPDNEISAKDGFIQDQEQWAELKASGGHSTFACTVCHDPHRSTTYDRSNAVRNTCTVCHGDMNMALHSGKLFARGDYREALTCESCHMAYATKSRNAAAPEVVGPYARMGDTRTHIFRISTAQVDYTAFFTPDGSRVLKDADGKAAVTADFVCLRCHNSVAMPTLAFTPQRAAEIAGGLHLPLGSNAPPPASRSFR